MKAILIILLLFQFANARVINIIDERDFEFQDFHFKIANDCRAFNLDSSKAGLYNEKDSLQYIKDAGFVLTAYSENSPVLISNIDGISSATFYPGIANFGKEIDSVQKLNYGVYHSKDYDENGQPLFGEKIPAWPVYYQYNEISPKANPMFVDNQSQRNSTEFFKPYFNGAEDIFSVSKAFLGNSFIQIENLISISENQMIFHYKIINYGEDLDSCLFSFYLDPDLTHHKRIFQDIYNDKLIKDELMFVNDINDSVTSLTLAFDNLHFPETDDELNIIHPFLSTVDKAKNYSLSLYDIPNKFDNLRKYQLSESENIDAQVNDLRVLINQKAFNFRNQDTAFFVYSINFAESDENIEKTYLSLKTDITELKNKYANQFTSVQAFEADKSMEIFDIYTTDGKLIKKNTKNINDIPKGLYILVDRNNSNNIKKIIID